MSNIKKLYIVIGAIIIVFLFLVGILAFTNYDIVELKQLLDRQDVIIEYQARELIYITNHFYIQCAYTEHLKMELEKNNLEYNLYSEFCKDYLFRFGELDDTNFLYENELDFENLLLRGSQKGEYPIDIKEY